MDLNDAFVAGCCADGCPEGAPTSCTADCSRVLLPIADSCGDWLKTDEALASGMAAVVSLAAMCRTPPSPPGPNCVTMLSAIADSMNKACCADGCPDGAPTTCDDACAAVLVPYFEVCSGFVAEDPDFAVLSPLISLCEDSKFGAFTGSIFSQRCSTAELRGYLGTTLPHACCGVGGANCPSGDGTIPPLPTACSPQCAMVYEDFYAECHPSFDGKDDAAAYDAFLALCQAQPLPGGH
jgi:hypothetical protein